MTVGICRSNHMNKLRLSLGYLLLATVLAGTAAFAAPPGGQPAAAKPGHTDGACTTITKQMVPLAGDDKAPGDADLHGKFSAAVRAYVADGSERGADPKVQLRPHVLTFSYR
jgi:phosphate-selective porin